MEKIGILLLAFATSLVSVQAQAQAQQKTGSFYLGGGAMHTLNDAAPSFAVSLGGGSASDNATGYKLYAGYRGEVFGLEAGYYNMGLFQLTTLGGASTEFNTTAIVGWVTASTPLGASFNMTGKVGLAYTQAEFVCLQSCAGLANTERTGSSVPWAVGAGWKLTPAFQVRAEYERFGSVRHSVGLARNTSAYRMISVSGQLDF